jgi:hypothetical protein
VSGVQKVPSGKDLETQLPIGKRASLECTGL